MANVINTPGADTMTNALFSDNVNLTSMESFHEPGGKDDLIKANGGGRLGKPRRPQQQRQQQQQNMYTPQQGNRAIFGEIRNRGPQQLQGEFTPLLKSVHRDNVMNKLNTALGAAGQQTPLFMKENMMGNSPALPRPDSSVIDGSSYGDEAATPVAMGQGMNSSEASTPTPQLKGKGGVLDDGQLTLREQEKIIDEIKKENFGLKLKIFFLDERLGKLGPEVNDQALKENVEIKVERATLKAELKRYKKSLLDSETLIAELRNQAMENQRDAQQRFANQRQSEKDNGTIQDLMDQLAQREDDIKARDEEIRRLKAEINDRDSTEEEDAQQLERLQKQIMDLEFDLSQLRGQLEDAQEQAENAQDEANRLRNEIYSINEKHQDEVERVRDEIREKSVTMKSRVQKLETEKQSLADKVEVYENEREGAESELANKVMDLEFELSQLRGQLEDAQEQAEDAQDEANRLRNEICSINEKHQDEVERVRDEIREKSVTMKSRVQERDESRMRLQKELDQLHAEHNNLVLLHNEKNQEVQNLKSRIEELTGNLAGEDDLKTGSVSQEQLKAQLQLVESRFEAMKKDKTALQEQLTTANTRIADIKTGSVSQEQLKAQLQFVESRFEAMRKDKTALQEQLTTANTRIADIEAKAQDIEAERDELQTRVIGMSKQLGATPLFDSEKLELRKAKGKLEAEVEQLQAERENLANKVEEVEMQLEEAFNQAIEDEKKLETEIKQLKAKLQSVNEANERASQTMRRELSRLNNHVEELQEQRDSNNGADRSELEALQQDLAVSRQREQDLKQSERAAKDQVGDLRQKIHRLETELHEAKMSRPRSPRDAKAQQERQELHEHLMKARLEIEELQHQVESHDRDTAARNMLEKELQEKVKSLRSQRTVLDTQVKKSDLELQKLRGKLERNKERAAQMQEQFDEETKALKKKIMQETRSVKDGVVAAEERHKKELKGLMKNNKYLRARVAREEGFRQDLCFTKRFFMMMVNLYGACNEANLQMLAQMGIVPDISIREKRPSLRAVGHAVIATIRMRNRRQEWSPNEALGKTLASKLHQVRSKTAR